MLARGLPEISRSTLNQRPAALTREGQVQALGVGRSTHFVLAAVVDVDKADYIRGLAAFYELGSTTVIEQTFVRGYVRSIARVSRIPDALRVGGFDLDGACELLVGFVNSGSLPADVRARVFVAGA